MARKYKILAVDDSSRDLELVSALIDSLGYYCDTALSGGEALAKMSSAIDLLLTDVMMPGMDGFQLVRRIRTQYQDLPIMMITALSGKEDRLRAVEAGANDYITKPIDKVELKIRSAALLKTREAQETVKVLWRDTLRGSIKLLSDMLAMLKPDAFGRASRIAPYVRSISAHVGDPNPWITETAALLSVLGFLTLPDNLIRRACKGKQLSCDDAVLIKRQKEVASDLIKNIPRMDSVARIVLYQEKHFDGSGYPQDDIKGDAIPLGARIIALVNDFDTLVCSGISKAEAFRELNNRKGWYDPEVLYALGVILGDEAKYSTKSKSLYELRVGMVIAKDVFTLQGNQKLIGRGQELSQSMIEYLKKYSQGVGVAEPIEVVEPIIQ